PGFFRSYGVHSLHGRALPFATGAKLANHDMTVIVTGGDGDGYGIGLNHFIQAMRRNIDITYIVMDNETYGLTTGQVSPTSETGMVTKTTPHGNLEGMLNPLALALASGCGFVARGFSGQPKHLLKLYTDAIQYPGFSLIDVFSPCVTFNKHNSYEWFRKRVSSSLTPASAPRTPPASMSAPSTASTRAKTSRGSSRRRFSTSIRKSASTAVRASRRVRWPRFMRASRRLPLTRRI